MTTIPETIAKLVPVTSVTLDTIGRMPKLVPLKDVYKDLQMAIYWLSEAKAQLDASQQTNTLSHGDVPEEVQLSVKGSPTLLGLPEHFAFLKKSLQEIHEEVEIYSEETFLPPRVLHKVTKGNDKIMEALFNTQLANHYYGQIRRIDSGQ